MSRYHLIGSQTIHIDKKSLGFAVRIGVFGSGADRADNGKFSFLTG